MAKFFDTLLAEHREFIAKQHLFFVASAPLSAQGHVNVSPKGMNTFRVLGDNTVAYLDLTGSGNETSAHLQENGRMTVMFCAFDGAPLILRLYGHGRVILPQNADWQSVAPHFEMMLGARQIIEVAVEKVQTSCGYAVPLYTYEADRPTLIKWAEAKGEDGLEAYRAEKNVCSLDGLPTPLGESLGG